MNTREKEAHARVLTIVRANKPGVLAMRKGLTNPTIQGVAKQKACLVVKLSGPGAAKTIIEEDTWIEVLSKIESPAKAKAKGEA